MRKQNKINIRSQNDVNVVLRLENIFNNMHWLRSEQVYAMGEEDNSTTKFNLCFYKFYK